MPRYEATTSAADPQKVFDLLDDQAMFAAHMTKRSAMMGGGAMSYKFDSGQGRAVGSHTTMSGRAFGLRLFVDEVVTVREPPRRKSWSTTGQSRLLIMSGYRMGYGVEPADTGSRLTVWIDYDLPRNPLTRFIAAPLAALYARWCVDRMVGDLRGAEDQE